MHRVLGPLVRSMGVDLSLDVERPGYVPGGGGVIEMNVTPRRQGLDALVSATLVRSATCRALPCPAIWPNNK